MAKELEITIDTMASPIPTPLREWLDEFNTRKRELCSHGFKFTPSNVRETLDRLTQIFVTDIPELPQVRDDLIAGPDYQVPVRLYHPDPDTTLPVVVFAHGGGHMAGSLVLYDAVARKIAKASQHLVVSVDYRLAPECPYPAGLKDLIAVIKGVPDLLDSLQWTCAPRLSLVGDSAGAALCATAAHRLQFEPATRIHRQALIYPSLDYTLSFPSVKEYATGFLLELDRVNWYFDHYFQNAEDRRAASPLYMPCTTALPETFVITAEHCLLRDEGIAYVERLQSAGINVEHYQCNGMIHAFLNLENLVSKQCGAVYRRIGDFLNR